jgi:hypothetical protein
MGGVDVSRLLLGGEEDVFEGSEGFVLFFGECRGDYVEVSEADLWGCCLMVALSAAGAFSSFVKGYGKHTCARS